MFISNSWLELCSPYQDVPKHNEVVRKLFLEWGDTYGKSMIRSDSSPLACYNERVEIIHLYESKLSSMFHQNSKTTYDAMCEIHNLLSDVICPDFIYLIMMSEEQSQVLGDIMWNS